jgi:hypothetical protein
MIGILPIAADPVAPRWNHCRVDAQDYKSELHHLEDLQINDICSWINSFNLTYLQTTSVPLALDLGLGLDLDLVEVGLIH